LWLHLLLPPGMGVAAALALRCFGAPPRRAGLGW
jgi:hypothetical protein